MEISTAVNLTDGRSKLRIVSMELAHVGSALVLDGESGFNLFSTGVDNTSKSSGYCYRGFRGLLGVIGRVVMRYPTIDFTHNINI